MKFYVLANMDGQVTGYAQYNNVDFNTISGQIMVSTDDPNIIEGVMNNARNYMVTKDIHGEFIIYKN